MALIHRLVCEECGAEFERKPQRGRMPKRCPECRGEKHNSPFQELRRGDKEELEFLMERLGVNRAEAIRTAIRVYAALLRKGS